MDSNENPNDKAPDNNDPFLTEYQASQASAEHHDSLVWTVTSIIWTGNLILLGFVLSNLAQPNTRMLSTILCLLGILLVICVCVFALTFADIKRQKYARCKVLEARWGFKQHSQLRYLACVQTVLYVVVTLAFLVIWGIVIFVV